MPNKYLDSVQLGRLITKIKTHINTVIAGYLPTSGGSITGNLTVSGTITGDVTGDVTGNVTGNADTATAATNDANGNPIATTYLPLAGGTMTGTITASSDAMKSANNNSSLSIYGGNGNGNGAYIILCGKNEANYPGGFLLRAHDGTNSAYLIGKTNKSLTWNSKEVERVNTSGSSYIRYESGLQICWGSASANSDGTTATYPAAFLNVPTITLSNSIAGNHCWTSSITNTSVILKNATTTTKYNVYYIAVGFWK